MAYHIPLHPWYWRAVPWIQRHTLRFFPYPPPGPVRRLEAVAVTWVTLSSDKVHELCPRWEHHSCGVTPPFSEVMSFEWFNYLSRGSISNISSARLYNSRTPVNLINLFQPLLLHPTREDMSKHFSLSQRNANSRSNDTLYHLLWRKLFLFAKKQ